MAGPRARLRPGESCSFRVFGRNKNSTAEEKVRSPQSADDTESSKLPETFLGSSWTPESDWTLAGELGRSLHRGLARANPEPEKIRGKEWCSVTSVYSVKEGVTGSRPGPGGGRLGASSKAGRGGGVTQDVGGGPLRVQPEKRS